MLAIGSGLRYASRGGALWLLASVISLEISVWTVDVAFILMPFVPLLLFLLPVSRRRALLLLALCGAATLPAMIREWGFLRDPTSYQLIVLDYDEASGRYHLVRSLTGDELGDGADGAENAYRPERLIEQRGRTRWQREMLLE